LLPNQKHRIIKALQELGYVVGSTGSTAGDAKALKSADIGISLKGSPAVTKDAADMLLLKKEEPLQTLLNAVKLGTQQPSLSLLQSYIPLK